MTTCEDSINNVQKVIAVSQFRSVAKHTWDIFPKNKKTESATSKLLNANNNSILTNLNETYNTSKRIGYIEKTFFRRGALLRSMASTIKFFFDNEKKHVAKAELFGSFMNRMGIRKRYSIEYCQQNKYTLEQSVAKNAGTKLLRIAGADATIFNTEYILKEGDKELITFQWKINKLGFTETTLIANNKIVAIRKGIFDSHSVKGSKRASRIIREKWLISRVKNVPFSVLMLCLYIINSTSKQTFNNNPYSGSFDLLQVS